MLHPLFIGRRLFWWMLPTTAYTVAVMALVYYLAWPTWSAGDEITAVLGIALGILVVFRNNTAYDRWWEARKLWGQLNNDLRNLALKARAHAAVDEPDRQAFARLLVGFAQALRLHLRGETGVATVPGFADDPTTFPHAPGYIAGLIHQTLNRWNRQGKLDGTVWILDHHARSLMDVCGACERILKTPLASSYRALTGYGIILYMVAAPWAVALDFGWSGLPAILISMAFLLGMELTAESVEEPFGREGDDLPLDLYCQSMEAFVHAALSESPSGSAA